MSKKLLMISCHPDDEVLSCGGWLSRAKKLGYSIFLVWATNGCSSSSVSGGSNVRRNEAYAVAKELDATATFLDFRDNSLEKKELIPILDSLVREKEPDIVLWPFGLESTQHQDHIELHEAMVNLASRGRYGERVWIAGNTPVKRDPNFKPTSFLCFGPREFEVIYNLVKCHASELGKKFMRKTRISTRARYWADQGETESLYAEPYMVIEGQPPVGFFEKHHQVNINKDVLARIDQLGKFRSGQVMALIDSLAIFGNKIGTFLPDLLLERDQRTFLLFEESGVRIELEFTIHEGGFQIVGYQD